MATTKVSSLLNNAQITTLSDSSDCLKPKYMVNELRRLASFSPWKETIHPILSKSLLVKAGMYYDCTDNKVKCAGCDFQIESWSSGINPLELHMKTYPTCEFSSIQNNLCSRNSMF